MLFYKGANSANITTCSTCLFGISLYGATSHPDRGLIRHNHTVHHCEHYPDTWSIVSTVNHLEPWIALQFRPIQTFHLIHPLFQHLPEQLLRFYWTDLIHILINIRLQNDISM